MTQIPTAPFAALENFVAFKWHWADKNLKLGSSHAGDSQLTAPENVIYSDVPITGSH